MLGSLATSVTGFVTGWRIRPEQSERVHDQDSPTSRTAAEQEDRSPAVDVEQGRVEEKEDRCGGDGDLAAGQEEKGSDGELAVDEREPERGAAGDAAPSSEQNRSSAEDEAEQQHEERIEISGLASDSGSDNSSEFCRVCQQTLEEPLITLGCACRGGLARAHRSCIDAWFARKGSNKCEVCQEIAANVPAPATQPEQQFWVWRTGARRNGRRSTVRFQPLWAALMILIAGLLFDILISIFLGASALPVNIIIGILIVLGVGTVFRLMLECWRAREIRRLYRTHLRQNPIYLGSDPTEHADEAPGESFSSQDMVQLQGPYQVHAIVVSSHHTVRF